jgi:hypothetical protein
MSFFIGLGLGIAGSYFLSNNKTEMQRQLKKAREELDYLRLKSVEKMQPRNT